MSAEIVKLSGAAFCLAPPIGGLLVLLFSCLRKSHPSVRPPVQRPTHNGDYIDALKAIASSSGKN